MRAATQTIEQAAALVEDQADMYRMEARQRDSSPVAEQHEADKPAKSPPGSDNYNKVLSFDIR